MSVQAATAEARTKLVDPAHSDEAVGPGPDPAAARRAVARRLASGVSVLTAAHGTALHGTTVSAVTAVSREPLLICACLKLGSSLAALARAAGGFTVNILSSRQALLADWFADPARPDGAAQFARLPWSADPATGAPALGGSLAWLSCRVDRRLAAGDHEVIFGEVVAARSGDGRPLLIFDNQLHGADLYEVARRRGPDQARPHSRVNGSER